MQCGHFDTTRNSNHSSFLTPADVSNHSTDHFPFSKFRNYSAPVGERSIAISLSVCVSEPYPQVYLSVSGTAGAIFTIFCADFLCPWLGYPLAALRYVMYFRFYGWRHVTVVGNMAMRAWRRCDTGAESDVYECLVWVLLSVPCNTIFDNSFSHCWKLAVDLKICCCSLTANEMSLDCSFVNNICEYVVSNTSTNFAFSYVFGISSLGEFISHYSFPLHCVSKKFPPINSL